MSLAVFSTFLMLLVQFQRGGFRVLESDSRKLTATQTTHVVAETVHKDLFDARWAWVAPLASLDTGKRPDLTAPDGRWILGPARPAGAPVDRTLPGGPLLYVGLGTSTPSKEYFFDAVEGRLVVAGHERPERFADVRFLRAGAHVVEYVVRADLHLPNTDLPSHRERSTIVGAVHLQPEAEEDWYGGHAWEAGHRWCVHGRPVHSGFTDPP